MQYIIFIRIKNFLLLYFFNIIFTFSLPFHRFCFSKKNMCCSLKASLLSAGL